MGLALNTFLKRAPRHSVNMHAWIRREGYFGTRECRVIDISRTGVKLEVENVYSIPDRFLLLFAKGDHGQQASVVWRRGTQVGAEFA
jgi:PilZ domain-containing protein